MQPKIFINVMLIVFNTMIHYASPATWVSRDNSNINFKKEFLLQATFLTTEEVSQISELNKIESTNKAN